MYVIKNLKITHICNITDVLENKFENSTEFNGHGEKAPKYLKVDIPDLPDT